MNNSVCYVPLYMSKSLVTYDSKTRVFSYDIFLAILFYYFILQYFFNLLRAVTRDQPFIEEIPEVEVIESDEDTSDAVAPSEEDTDDPEDDQWLFTGHYLELPGTIVLLTTYNKSWRFQLKDTYYYLTQEMVDSLSKQLVKSKD